MGHKHSRHVQHALEDHPFREGELPPCSPAAHGGTSASVQYAMQVQVRGGTAVGKTSLSKRLQGEELPLEYASTKKTEHSQVVWTDLEDPTDSVEVTVWEVVENSTAAHDVLATGGSPMETEHADNSSTTGGLQSIAQDTQRMDGDTVLRPAADAVLLLVDPTRKSTLDTAIEILKGVPADVDVLVLLNFADIDMSLRELTKEDVDEQVSRVLAEESAERIGLIRVASCSCIDCYGLEAIYIFLRVPFLRLKRREHVAAMEELAAKIEQASERCFDATLMNHEEFLHRCGERDEAAMYTSGSHNASERANSWTKAVKEQLRRLSKTRDETSTITDTSGRNE